MPGRLVGGRYRLVRPLGAGGMGQVWAARDEVLNADVAIKELQLDEDGSEGGHEEAVARAIAEARHAAALRDQPNIVAVHDVVTEDGGPWTVMRLVQGRSLAQELRSREVLPVEEAAGIAEGVLRALAAAHRIGIIHRDVKPSNIMLADDGTILLTDFGIAKNHADTALTATGSLVGSLEYVAPERFDGGRDTPAVDLFGLGVTLYEMLEGTSPFRRGTAVATIAAIALDPVPVPRRAGRLTPLVTAMLAREPGERPDAARALALLGDGRAQGVAGRAEEGRSAASGGWAAAHPPTVPDGAVVPGRSGSGVVRSLRRPWIALGTAVAVAAAAAVSWVAFRESDDPTLPPLAPGKRAVAVLQGKITRVYTVAAGDGHLWEAQLEGNGGTWTPTDLTKSGGAPATPKTGPAVVVRDKDISVFTVDPDTHHLKATRLKDGQGPWSTSDLSQDFGATVDPDVPPAAVYDPGAGVTRVYTVAAGSGHLMEVTLDKTGKPEAPYDLTQWGQAPATQKAGPAVVVRGKDVHVFTVDGKNSHLMDTRLKDDGKQSWSTVDLSPSEPLLDPSVQPAAVYDPEARSTRVYTVAAGSRHLTEVTLDETGNPKAPYDLTQWGQAPATQQTGIAAAMRGKTISIFTVDPDSHRLRATQLVEGKGSWTTGDLTEGGTTQVGLNLLPAAVGDPEAGVTRVYAVDSDGALRMWSTGPGSHT
ncbi:hypothetical protein BU198_27300 [Streptomyces sp. CBMA156]|nr:hypothetical protein [Streptomyces sp. CBMA156]